MRGPKQTMEGMYTYYKQGLPALDGKGKQLHLCVPIFGRLQAEDWLQKLISIPTDDVYSFFDSIFVFFSLKPDRAFHNFRGSKSVNQCI